MSGIGVLYVFWQLLLLRLMGLWKPCVFFQKPSSISVNVTSIIVPSWQRNPKDRLNIAVTTLEYQNLCLCVCVRVCVHAQDKGAGSHTGIDFLFLGQNTWQLTNVKLPSHKDFHIYDETSCAIFVKVKICVHGSTNTSENRVIYRPRKLFFFCYMQRCWDLSLYSISALTSLNHSQMLINTFPYFYPCVDASWARKWVCFGCSRYIPARAALSRCS